MGYVGIYIISGTPGVPMFLWLKSIKTLSGSNFALGTLKALTFQKDKSEVILAFENNFQLVVLHSGNG